MKTHHETVPEQGITVIKQLSIDVINLINRLKLAWKKAMEHRIPDQEVISYVGDNYDFLRDDLQLTGGTFCSGLKNTQGEIILGCVLIERTGELMLLGRDDGMSKKDTTILEIILIEKLLIEGFDSHIPTFLLMEDLFSPAHIRKLNELGIILQISIDQHGARQVVLTRQG